MSDSVRALSAFGGCVVAYVAAGVAREYGTPRWAAFLSLMLVSMMVPYALYRPHVIRRERRAKGQCLRCGYDLTGNVSGVCPECGEVRP